MILLGELRTLILVWILVKDTLIAVVLYADDIFLLAETEQELQLMLDKLNDWSIKWRMGVNETKTNIVHFRKQRLPLTNFVFHIGDILLVKVDRYINILELF